MVRRGRFLYTSLGTPTSGAGGKRVGWSGRRVGPDGKGGSLIYIFDSDLVLRMQLIIIYCKKFMLCCLWEFWVYLLRTKVEINLGFE